MQCKADGKTKKDLLKNEKFRSDAMVKPMRDFQTWLITPVMVARGAACQVISELPVCPDYTVYTSQAAEQDNKTHLTWPKQAVPTGFSVYRCHNTVLGTCISQRQGKCQVWPWELAICQ